MRRAPSSGWGNRQRRAVRCAGKAADVSRTHGRSSRARTGSVAAHTSRAGYNRRGRRSLPCTRARKNQSRRRMRRPPTAAPHKCRGRCNHWDTECCPRALPLVRRMPVHPSRQHRGKQCRRAVARTRRVPRSRGGMGRPANNCRQSILGCTGSSRCCTRPRRCNRPDTQRVRPPLEAHHCNLRRWHPPHKCIGLVHRCHSPSSH